jgi:hypothetical protein
MYNWNDHLRRMRWTVHVENRGEKRNAYSILLGVPEEKRPLGRLDVGGRIILI